MIKFSLKRLRFINYLLAVLILTAALLLVRSLISLSLSKKNLQLITAGDETTHKMLPGKKDLLSYSVILEKNPFGLSMRFYPISGKHALEISGHKPISELLLVGTVVGPKNLSYAIFESMSPLTQNTQEVIAYGRDVFNYGTLIDVEKEYVRLRQGNNVITVPIIEINEKRDKSQTDNKEASQTAFVKKIAERQYLLNRDKIQEALEDPKQILTHARLLPNIQDGKQEGFKVYEVKPGGLYESLGLRNGDILLRINGLEISGPEVAIQAMTALRGMDRINLDIVRNEARLSLNYQIR